MYPTITAPRSSSISNRLQQGQPKEVGGITRAVREAFSSARELAERIRQINVALTGPVPENPESGAGERTDDLTSELARLNESLKECHERISHAYNALGL